MTHSCRNVPRRAINLNRASSAFTLMELLVVIAIIAILAALLLPVISKSKLRALQIQCTSNLREIGLANSMYLSDYGESLLNYDFNGKNNLWMGRLIAYQAKVDAVRICPAARDPNPANSHFGTADKTWYYDSRDPAKRWYGSYCLNGWLYSGLTNQYGGMPRSDQNKVFQKGSNIGQPAKTPVFADGIYVDSWPRVTDGPPSNLYRGEEGARFGAGMGRMLIDRHGGIPASSAPTNIDTGQKLPGAINVACYDGHVALVKLEELWNYSWNQTWVPPTPRPK